MVRPLEVVAEEDECVGERVCVNGCRWKEKDRTDRGEVERESFRGSKAKQNEWGRKREREREGKSSLFLNT